MGHGAAIALVLFAFVSPPPPPRPTNATLKNSFVLLEHISITQPKLLEWTAVGNHNSRGDSNGVGAIVVRVRGENGFIELVGAGTTDEESGKDTACRGQGGES